MRNEPLEPASLEVTIDSPADGEVVAGAAIGHLLDVTGTVDGNGINAATVKVVVKCGSVSVPARVVADPYTQDVTWTANLQLSASGKYALRAECTATGIGGPLNKSAVISVYVDNNAPTLLVTSGPTPMSGTPFFVDIGVKASDADSGLQTLAWSLNGSPFTSVAVGNDREFDFNVHLSLASRTATYPWVVRARDRVGFVTDLSLSLEDDASPNLEITYPPNNVKVPHDGKSAQVNLKGTASDAWSGVKRVEWSLDGGAPTPVLTSDGWATWTAPVVFGLNDAGRTHRITVLAVDNIGHQTAKSLDLEVARPYQPREAKDLVHLG